MSKFYNNSSTIILNQQTYVIKSIKISKLISTFKIDFTPFFELLTNKLPKIKIKFDEFTAAI